jgi:predicted  nucleic acid-binding Zn-ribbon protein
MLYDLQKIDLQIARARARLREIESLLSGDESVAKASAALDSASAGLKPWQTRARDLDFEIKSVVQKSKSTEDDLYSGRVRSPKALQELQEEIAALKRQQGGLEDSLLEAMMEVEGHQAEVDAAQSALADARAAFAGQQTDLMAEQETLKADAAQLEEHRKAAAAHVEPPSLAAYEKLRQRFRGQAVALLQEEGCSVCGVGQTSTNVKAVRSGRALAYCESCGRILADRS